MLGNLKAEQRDPGVSRNTNYATQFRNTAQDERIATYRKARAAAKRQTRIILITVGSLISLAALYLFWLRVLSS